MADLVTHYLAARAPSTRFSRPLQAAFVIGTFLPDLIGKQLEDVLIAGGRFGVPSHTVLGMAFYAYIACFSFEERVRRGAWLGLWCGGLIHIGVDLLKDTLQAAPSAFFLFPFTSQPREIGLYEPIHHLWSIPVVIAIVVVWEWRAKRPHVWE